SVEKTSAHRLLLHVPDAQGIRACIDCSGGAGWCEVAAAQKFGDAVESGGPALDCCDSVVPQRAEIQRESEAFERAFFGVEHRGAEDAGERRRVMVEALGAAGQAVEHLRLLVGGGEECAI